MPRATTIDEVPIRTVPTVWLAAILLVASTGCGAALGDEASPSIEQTEAVEAPAETEEPAEVEETTAEPVPSGRDALDVAMAGNHPVVLWFWGAH